MTQEEQDEFSQVLDRLYTKTFEVSSMMKDGKIIVAYEKLGGVMKVIQQLSTRIKTIELENTSNSV